MPFAAVRDLDLYYELHGEGPPLLSISGSGGDLRRTAPETSPSNRHFRTAHYDQRGLGRTSVPDPPYTMADYADDAAALLDHLGWAAVPVLGVSFGGMVAQHLAVRHPHRVTRLVLACTSPGGAGGSSADLLALARQAGDSGPPMHPHLLDTRWDPEADDDVTGLAPIIALMEGAADGWSDGTMHQLEARAGHDVWDDLPGIDIPTMVIGGRHDGIAPPANLEAIASRIPDARLELCEGGHLFMLQDPTAWPTIIDFLRS